MPFTTEQVNKLAQVGLEIEDISEAGKTITENLLKDKLAGKEVDLDPLLTELIIIGLSVINARKTLMDLMQYDPATGTSTMEVSD